MWAIKNDANALIYKTETLTALEKELMITRGERVWGRIDLEFGTGMYTVLCLK